MQGTPKVKPTLKQAREFFMPYLRQLLSHTVVTRSVRAHPGNPKREF
jgi:hypothetical protein